MVTTLQPPVTSPLEPSPAPSEETVSFNGRFWVIYFFRPAILDEAELTVFVNSVGEPICLHVSNYFEQVFPNGDVSMPSCTFQPTGNRRRLIIEFRYTVRVQGGFRTPIQQPEIDEAVEEAFVGDALGELVEELESLPSTNPLADPADMSVSTVTVESPMPTLSPTVSESSDECVLLPAFMRAIPFLGAWLNAMLCMLLGSLF